MMLPLQRARWRDFDPFYLALVLLLAGLGILFISAASRHIIPPSGWLHSETVRQSLFLGVSLVALLVVLHVDYLWLARRAWLIYLLTLGGLLLVLVVGKTTGGGQRWLPLGPFRLQPSEFMKVALILALARLLQYYDRFYTIKGLIRPFLVTLVPMALILVQPDLGTALCCIPVLFVMLFVAGARWRHLLLVVLLGVLVAPIIFTVGLAEYQKLRIISFINQEETENIQDAGYQLAQAKLAIGSGGLLGKGYRQGTVPVPVHTTDFIFTIVAEEGGFLGGVAEIGLYLLLSLYLLGIAARTRERFGLLVASGTCALVSFQALVNIAMTMGLAPITGLTLPLASYGGSSLLSTFLLLGLVLNVSMRRLRPFGAAGPVST